MTNKRNKNKNKLSIFISKFLPKIKLASPFGKVFVASKRDFFNQALLFSLILHAILLTFKLTAEKLPVTKNIDTPLEVSLVNSRSEEAPDKADFLAQHNLRGGGEFEKHAFTTPLPAINDGNGELIKLIKKQEQSSESQQKQILSEQNSFTVNQNHNAANKQSENAQQGRDAQTINQEIAKLEAEINKQIQQMAKRPKRMAFTAANAKSVVYAKYYDNIRGAIEEYGTTYFPKDSSGNPMYGELILIIRINKEGKLGYNKDQYYATSVEVARSSGNPLLDKRAMEIVKACAPFGAFPADMAQSIDILEVISTFKFNKQGFATTLQGN
jgi:protein TonB